MTPEAQRIALAEFCGWTLEQTNVHDGKCWHLNGIQSEDAPPDYLNDLNAVHEVFAKMDNVQQAKFGEELAYTLKIHDWTNCKLIVRAVMKATAPQRCEAILRTLGRWE